MSVYSGVIPYIGKIGIMFSCVPISIVAYLVSVALSATIIPFDLLRKAVMEK